MSQFGLAQKERDLPAAVAATRACVCASVSLLPEARSEPFCTVFREGISESIDDSTAQFIRQPDGTSVATDRLAAAAVKFGNGSAQRICATQLKEERTRSGGDIPNQGNAADIARASYEPSAAD